MESPEWWSRDSQAFYLTSQGSQEGLYQETCLHFANIGETIIPTMLTEYVLKYIGRVHTSLFLMKYKMMLVLTLNVLGCKNIRYVRRLSLSDWQVSHEGTVFQE